MDISKADKTNGMIQFASYRYELPSQINEDVEASSYKTKTQYFNALSDKLLNLDYCLQDSSRIEELFERLSLLDSLPLDDIRALALSQNRDCSQMIIHLVQESLENYSEDP